MKRATGRKCVVIRVVRCVGHVARMGRTETRTKFCGKNMKERDPLDDLVLDGRIAYRPNVP
jgi:hypothetical protein